MANRIVNDGPAISNRLCVVPASTPAKTFVNVGGKRGLTKDKSRIGDSGLSYAVVGTADVVAQDAVAIAFADGAPVYADSSGAFTATSAGNTLIGYADRAKTSTSAPLYVVLVPGAITA